MVTVSGAPGDGESRSRHLEDVPDVLSMVPRPEVVAVAVLAARGMLDLVRIGELFAGRADGLVEAVRLGGPAALRDAYALLFVEERLITRAVGMYLRSVDIGLSVRVQDAIAELVGAVTRVEHLAEVWAVLVDGSGLES